MLYGFGGWANFPWAAYIAPSGSVLLGASAGVVALAGETEPFGVSEAGNVGLFFLTGVSTALSIDATISAGAVSFAGVSSALKVSGGTGVGRVLLAGLATTDIIGEPLNPNGVFATFGMSGQFHIVATDRAGAFMQSGFPQALSRDFVNWASLPLDDKSWNSEDAPLPAWATTSQPLAAWNDASKPAPSWSALTPPSSNWTTDPAQQIPPPVSE